MGNLDLDRSNWDKTLFGLLENGVLFPLSGTGVGRANESTQSYHSFLSCGPTETAALPRASLSISSALVFFGEFLATAYFSIASLSRLIILHKYLLLSKFSRKSFLLFGLFKPWMFRMTSCLICWRVSSNGFFKLPPCKAIDRTKSIDPGAIWESNRSCWLTFVWGRGKIECLFVDRVKALISDGAKRKLEVGFMHEERESVSWPALSVVVLLSLSSEVFFDRRVVTVLMVSCEGDGVDLRSFIAMIFGRWEGFIAAGLV